MTVLGPGQPNPRGVANPHSFGADLSAFKTPVIIVTTDDGPMVGYSLEQALASDYDAAPAFTLRVRNTAGAQTPFPQSLAVLYDGSWAVAGFAAEPMMVIPPALQQNGALLNTDFLRKMGGGGGLGPQHPVMQMPNGDVLWIGITAERRTLANFYAGAVNLGPVSITGLTSPFFDVLYDQANDIIWQSGGDALIGYDSATFEVAGAAVITQHAAGANLLGSQGFDIDSSGGGWLARYDSLNSTLAYYDAAALAALTPVPSNPAPTRVLSMAAGTAKGFTGLQLDNTGGCWVAAYEENTLKYFTAAQLAAGGVQAATRSIALPTDIRFPRSVRLALGYGLRLR